MSFINDPRKSVAGGILTTGITVAAALFPKTTADTTEPPRAQAPIQFTQAGDKPSTQELHSPGFEFMPYQLFTEGPSLEKVRTNLFKDTKDTTSFLKTFTLAAEAAKKEALANINQSASLAKTHHIEKEVSRISAALRKELQASSFSELEERGEELTEFINLVKGLSQKREGKLRGQSSGQLNWNRQMEILEFLPPLPPGFEPKESYAPRPGPKPVPIAESQRRKAPFPMEEYLGTPSRILFQDSPRERPGVELLPAPPTKSP